MDAAAELGRNPVVSKHRIQPECGDEQADAGRGFQNKAVSRDQFLRRKLNADRKTFIFPVQLTTCRIGNLIRLIHTLAICVTMFFVFSSHSF